MRYLYNTYSKISIYFTLTTFIITASMAILPIQSFLEYDKLYYN